MWCTGRMRSSILTILVAAAFVLTACGDDPEDADDSSAGEVEGVQVESGQTANHVDDPTYDADPPSGGDHLGIPLWLNCGIYDEPVPDGSAVHSLEHGVVWFTYDPAADVDVDALEALYESRPDRVILSPYPDLPSPVVAVAWERRLEVDSSTDPRLAEFLDAYVNGAAAPEPSATCDGGVGL